MAVYSWPVVRGTKITQPFGTNPGGHNPSGGHTGTDLAMAFKAPVYAAGDGVIEHAGPGSGSYLDSKYWIVPASAGNWIELNHGNGQPTSTYGHLASWYVKPGQVVKRGQLIGGAGASGLAYGIHLHFEMIPDGFILNGDPTYGRRNPALWCGDRWALEGISTLSPASTTVLAPNERLVTAGYTIKGRTAPNSDGALKRTVAGPAREIFDGWVKGESVNGNAVWFHDRENLYYWSGNFANHSTSGLPDLNPKPAPVLLATQRTAVPEGAQRRSAPDKNAQAVGERQKGVLNFRGYVTAPAAPYPDATKVWFVGADALGGYYWAGAFTQPGTTGLPDLTASLLKPAAPAPAYTFAADLKTVNGIAVEVIPAHAGNVDTENFPADPSMTVCHWWNAPSANPSIEGVINEFTLEGSFKSAHLVIGEDRVVQMVALADRAYHAGAGGNGWWGLEISPFAIERGADGQPTARALKIRANVRDAIVQLLARNPAPMDLILHKNVPGNATACSDLELSAFLPAIPAPAPEAAPAPVAPVLTPAQATVLAGFADYLTTLKES